jgi:hypothetical protein
MNKHVFAVLAALCFAASTANAVTVRGTPSCGSWVENRSTPNNWVAVANIAWLNGFLSGLAAASNKDFLNGTDLDSALVWVDNYCRSNPLNDLDDAGKALGTELVKRMSH